jgi:hypothetical protein
LVKFEKNHGTFNEEWKKKTPSLPTFVNRFKRNYAAFRRGGGKNPLSSMTLDQFA